MRPRRAVAMIRAAVLALAFLPGAAAAAEEPAFALGGTVTERVYASYAAAEGGSFEPAATAYGQAACLELRLDAAGPEGGVARASAHAAADLLVRSGVARAASGGELPALDARARELYARLDLGGESIEAGRTIVNYGRCVAWRAVDIFSEYDKSGPTALRLGTDALKIDASFGATGRVEAVAAPSISATSLAAGRYSLRASGLAGPVDGALLGAWDGEAGDWLVGADFKADAEAGIYGEGLCALAKGRDARFRAAAGADWSFSPGGSGKLVALAEYCYDEIPASGSYARGAPDTHNAYVGLSWVADRAAIQAGASYSLPGGISSASLVISVDAAQGATLVVYARGADGAQAIAAEAGISLEVDF
jgi:hypothetical protein